MDCYHELTTVADQRLANLLCSVLEEAEIPVMLEHLRLTGDHGDGPAFRLLVPAGVIQTATRLVDVTRANYGEKANSRISPLTRSHQ